MAATASSVYLNVPVVNAVFLPEVKCFYLDLNELVKARAVTKVCKKIANIYDSILFKMFKILKFFETFYSLQLNLIYN